MAGGSSFTESSIKLNSHLVERANLSYRRCAERERDDMLKLYTAENSICTQKVFLTLLEKGLDWESEYLDLFKNEQYRPEYLQINPKGVVPSLVFHGKVIIESNFDL